MRYRTAVVAGAYGHLGRYVTRLLLDWTNLDLVLAGRNAERIEATAADLRPHYPGRLITGFPLDVTDYDAAVAVFRTVDLAILCCGVGHLLDDVAHASQKAETDLISAQWSPGMTHELLTWSPLNQGRDQCLVLDAGFHPGLIRPLLRKLGRELDHPADLEAAVWVHEDWRRLELSTEMQHEIGEMIRDWQSVAIRNGRWEEFDLTDPRALRRFTFDDERSNVECPPIDFAELRGLEWEFPSLRNGGTYAAGFGATVDHVIMPLAYGLVKLHVSPVLAGKLMSWGLRQFAGPPYESLLLAQGRSESGETCRILLRHPESYFLTAAGVVTLVRQLQSGLSRRPGVHTQGELLDPDETLRDLARMGIRIECPFPLAEPAVI